MKSQPLPKLLGKIGPRRLEGLPLTPMLFLFSCVAAVAQVHLDLDVISAPSFYLTVSPTHTQQIVGSFDCLTPPPLPSPNAPLGAGQVTLWGGKLYYAPWQGFHKNVYFTSRSLSLQPAATPPCLWGEFPGSQPTVTISFGYEVSNPSFHLYAGDAADSLVVQDNLGHVQSYYMGYGAISDTIVTLPWKGITSITITPGFNFQYNRGRTYYISDITYTGDSPVTAVDPVTDLQNGNLGNQVTTNSELLARFGSPVSAIAADNAARVVLRIKANTVGEQLTLTLLNDQSQQSSSTDADGGVAGIVGQVTSSQLQLTSVPTSQGPMAFAIYFPPTHFSRNFQDNALATRKSSSKSSHRKSPASRPSVRCTSRGLPSVLVHGLWDEPKSWDTFKPLVLGADQYDSRFFVERARFDNDLPPILSADTTFMLHGVPFTPTAKENSMGIAYNAPNVLQKIKETVANYRKLQNVAASQADVVGHSMGGLVTRGTLSLPQYGGAASFGAGEIHRLITVGTPHLGSPASSLFLDNANTCTRSILASQGNVALRTVVLQGNSSSQSGAVGDMQGDGMTYASLSPGLSDLWTAHGYRLMTALVAGNMNANNLNGLNTPRILGLFSVPQLLRAICDSGTDASKWDPLPLKLTPDQWPTVMSANSDGIVPLTSELANQSAYYTHPGIVHSSGLVALGFNGPHELNTDTVANKVIELLNATVTGPPAVYPFYLFP